MMSVDEVAGNYVENIAEAFEAADVWSAAEVKRLTRRRVVNPSEQTERDYKELVKFNLAVKQCQLFFLEQMDKKVFESDGDFSQQRAQLESVRDAFREVLES